MNNDDDGPATRGELHATRDELRVEIQATRGELHATRDELRVEIQATRDELHATRDDLKQEIRDLRTELVGSINHVVETIGGEMAVMRGDMAGLRGDMVTMRADLSRELAGHVRAAAADNRRFLATLDDRYRDLPGRVATLERELDEHRSDTGLHPPRRRR